MADIYSAIATADPAVVERLADVIELRAGDRRQAGIRTEFLDAVPFPGDARVLEIGCGTGVVCRALATRPGVAEVVGVDPSPGFLRRARELAAGLPNVTFVEGDGREVPLPDSSFDVVVLYTTLCHVPGPERVLAEAYRLLKPRGRLAVLDGDYAITSVAKAPRDPLQCCIDAALVALVNDPWLARRLPALVREAGFVDPLTASHGYVGIESPDYMFTLVDRGGDAMVAAGLIGAELAAALKAEARRRASAGTFFGQICYFSLIADKRH